MSTARVFFVGGLISYRALFNWLRPAVYIPTMLLQPVCQIVFFTLLGRYSGVGDDRYFVIGNAVQASAIAGVFGMVMMLANEREVGTLSAVLATPANRLALYFGRALPVIANGLFISAFGLAAGFALTEARMPLAAVPALAAIVVVAVVSCAMFGLALGAVSLRIRDLWVGSNLTIYLMLLLCGGTVPLSALPAGLAAIGRILPLTHGILAAREVAAGATLSDVGGLLGWEAVIGLAYGAAGYGLLRYFEAENRRRASLDLN